MFELKIDDFAPFIVEGFRAVPEVSGAYTKLVDDPAYLRKFNEKLSVGERLRFKIGMRFCKVIFPIFSADEKARLVRECAERIRKLGTS